MRPVVVFDTNILFSGLGWRGKAHQCLMAAREGIVESVTCQEILAELEAVLRLKRNMPEDDIVEAVNEILLFSRVVQIANTLTGVVSDLEDHEDHKVLECAVVGGASHIVTGDRRHLLPLGSYQGIAIVSAADFMGLVASL
ncbi:putative toxin-antitoxin system toxin component, PIN family [Synechococcus sp. RC10A2]|uniref:putative toxin-antitoxin system toxin component, PIN family n=1 Tax=Synechococcus sp. RC10A2 TaxID=2964529 RepID=UPI0039C7013A